MSHPSVTVVIPCYNREDLVREAVQSVLDQDYDGVFDVVAVDDHSTDGTWEVLQSIADPRLRSVRNDGKGVSAARNCGAAQTASDWVAYQDSDDVWLPGKLQRQMARAVKLGAVASYCGMVVKADARPDTPVQDRFPRKGTAPLEGNILPSLIWQSFISTQMAMIRRDVLEAVGGFDTGLQALVDWDLMLRVSGQGPVAFLDADLVVQRMSGNSITRSSHKRLAAQEHILRKHHDLLAATPKALAFHNHRIAGGHKLFKAYRAGLPFARTAARLAPANPRYLANWLYLEARARLS